MRKYHFVCLYRIEEVQGKIPESSISDALVIVFVTN